MNVIVYLAICVLPAGAFALISRALGWLANYNGRAHRPTAEDLQHDLDRYRRDLRRLSSEHTRVLNADQPAKVARLRAIELAYDDTLLRACQALAIEEPDTSPIPSVNRLQVEADLAVHGFTW